MKSTAPDSIIHLHQFRTTWGTIRTACSRDRMMVLTLPTVDSYQFDQQLEKLFARADFAGANHLCRTVELEVRAYFANRLKRFSIPVSYHCSAFQEKALRAVAKVPYGTTRTYGQIAETIGHPNAYRAVGTANACNRLPLIVPCHRIVAHNGIGGYGGGEELKARLLRLEGAIV